MGKRRFGNQNFSRTLAEFPTNVAVAAKRERIYLVGWGNAG
jgi:hypothetical protein